MEQTIIKKNTSNGYSFMLSYGAHNVCGEGMYTVVGNLIVINEKQKMSVEIKVGNRDTFNFHLLINKVALG